MAETIWIDLKERPLESLEPLEPDKLRRLLALAYEVGASPLYVHDRAVLELTGPEFVIVAAGKAQEEKMPRSKLTEIRCAVEVVTRVTCVCCFDWDAGMGQIEAQQAFSSSQSAGPKYSAPVFKYCPWCGALLLKCKKSREVVVG